MCKRFVTPILALLVFLFTWGAYAYTVVLKNGKAMTGTLISETTDGIIFKDDAGVQFSLKKSSLDLQKMASANQPPPEAAPPPAESAVETQPVAPPRAAAKKSRTYTKEDIDKLKERYGDMTVGTPIENMEDFSSPGLMKPEAYIRILKEAASSMPSTLEHLGTLGATVSTLWEQQASTGGKPKQAIQEYLGNQSAIDLMNSYTAEMNAYEDAKEQLSNPPKGYEEAYKTLTAAITDMQNCYKHIRGWEAIENSSLFKSRLDELSATASSDVGRLQSWQPPTPPPAPQNTEAPEAESQSQP